MLALVWSTAFAEWTAISDSSDLTVYANYSSIRTTGVNKKMWDLKDFKTVQSTDGVMYHSSKTLIEYDCEREQQRLLFFSWFSGEMGKGSVVFEHLETSSWQPNQPDSIGEGLWKVACGKQ